ncbi:chromosome partitioning protein [Pilimelia anulata]|uniref:chromosome partitioning protein n=1 Tax=Pilimelia anulata TaxID=53371 RepID=UPI00166A94E8|nr:chromosome partitioning protein [Pilimelia anulata]
MDAIATGAGGAAGRGSRGNAEPLLPRRTRTSPLPAGQPDQPLLIPAGRRGQRSGDDAALWAEPDDDDLVPTDPYAGLADLADPEAHPDDAPTAAGAYAALAEPAPAGPDVYARIADAVGRRPHEPRESTPPPPADTDRLAAALAPAAVTAPRTLPAPTATTDANSTPPPVPATARTAAAAPATGPDPLPAALQPPAAATPAGPYPVPVAVGPAAAVPPARPVDTEVSLPIPALWPPVPEAAHSLPGAAAHPDNGGAGAARSGDGPTAAGVNTIGAATVRNPASAAPTGPNAAGRLAADPNATSPLAADPNAAGPTAVHPNATGPNSPGTAAPGTPLAAARPPTAPTRPAGAPATTAAAAPPAAPTPGQPAAAGPAAPSRPAGPRHAAAEEPTPPSGYTLYGTPAAGPGTAGAGTADAGHTARRRAVRAAPAPLPGAGVFDPRTELDVRPVPTADDFARRRAARPADPLATTGARAAVRRATLGLVKLGPGTRELEHRRYVETVRRNFGGLRQVTVVNPKGGAGKTVAVLLSAMTFGQHRGGYVLAWDNNETQGTLGMRAQQDFHSRTVRDLLRDLEQFAGAQGRVGDLSQYVRAQGEGMFDVLASDESATAGEMLTARAFAELREVVSRFYKLIFVDTGNNVRAENWQAAIDATDQLVVTMSARNDSAEPAARMLDHLEQTGRRRLVRQAVTVVSMPPTRKDIDLPAIQEHFAARTRAVLLAPYEKLVDSGEPVRYGQLTHASKDAWLRIAAAVAEGL